MNTIQYFFADELRLRTADGFLGWTAIIVLPLVQFAVLFLVFVEVFKARTAGDLGAEYVVFLVLGFWPWLAFSDTVLRLSSVLIEKADLAKKVRFSNPSLLVGVALATFFIHFAGFVAVFFVLLISGRVQSSEFIIAIPSIWIALFILSLSIGSICGIISVFVRDIPRITGILMGLLFFLTPVFYPLSGLPANMQEVLAFSPLVVLIKLNRAAFGVGDASHHDLYVAAGGISLVVVVAVVTTWRLRRDIVDFL